MKFLIISVEVAVRLSWTEGPHHGNGVRKLNELRPGGTWVALFKIFSRKELAKGKSWTRVEVASAWLLFTVYLAPQECSNNFLKAASSISVSGVCFHRITEPFRLDRTSCDHLVQTPLLK